MIALFNGLVGWVFSLAGIDGVTMQMILGKIFRPLMYLLSVPWAEAEAAEQQAAELAQGVEIAAKTKDIPGVQQLVEGAA